MSRRKVSNVEWVYRERATGRYFVRVQAYESPMHEGAARAWVDEYIVAGYELQAAIDLRERVRADIERGVFFVENYIAQTTPTLAELVDDLAGIKEAAGRRSATVYDFHLYSGRWLGWLGDTRADALTYPQVRAWWTHMTANNKPEIANKSLMTLRAVIEHAIRIGVRSDGNPAKALVKAKIPVRRERRRLGLAEFRLIVEQLRIADRRAFERGNRAYMGHASYFLTMAALAARGDEVCGLQWQDVDYEHKIVTLVDTKTAPTLHRTVSDALLDEFDAHLKRMKQGSPAAMAESDFVFPRTNGARANSGRPREIWAMAVEAAGFTAGKKNDGWTPHDVRRLGIELLYEAGGEQREVMQFVGHHVASVHSMYLQRNADRIQELTEKTNARLFDVEEAQEPDDEDPPNRARPPPSHKGITHENGEIETSS